MSHLLKSPADFEPLYAPQFAGLPGHPAHIFENPLTLYLLPSTPNKKAATRVATFSEVPSGFEPLYELLQSSA